MGSFSEIHVFRILIGYFSFGSWTIKENTLWHTSDEKNPYALISTLYFSAYVLIYLLLCHQKVCIYSFSFAHGIPLN